MKSLAALKVLVIVFALVILALLGILFFYNPTPTSLPAPSGAASSSTLPTSH